MSEQDFQNPFAALFPCSDEGEAFKTGVIPPQEIVEDPSEPPKGSGGAQGDSHLVSHFYEDVFRITLSKEPCCCRNGPSSLVFLNEVHIALHCQTDLDESCIERAVFERLLLEEPSQHIVRRKNTDEEDSIAGVKRVMFYLYQSYHRLKKLTDCKKFIPQERLKPWSRTMVCGCSLTGPFETAHHVIVTQTASALCQPEMFPDSKLGEDFMKLFLNYHDVTGHCEVLQQFLLDVSGSVVNVEGAGLAEVLTPAFAHLQAKLAGAGLFDRNLFLYVDTLNYFASSETLIKALLAHSMPREARNGKAYQQSLLGLPLGVSCLPPSEVEPFEFFREPGRSSAQDHAITEERLHLPLSTIARAVHRLFDKILRRSRDTREALLRWLGGCLDANAGRAKIWNSQLPEVYASLHASDGFFVNLSAVLLLLCKPFAEPRSPKLFRVDPLYSAAAPQGSNGVHIKSIAQETCLLPRDEPMAAPEREEEARVFSFSSEIFHLAHWALRLGFRVATERLSRLNQDLVRVQRMWEEARLAQGEHSEAAQRIKDNMERGMTKFLTYRTALLVPETLDLMVRFHLATSSWLAHLCAPEGGQQQLLAYVPEFVLENIVDCCLFVKRFSAKTFEMAGPSLEHFMGLVLLLMGSPERVRNPHLRAHLAEMLEALMPSAQDEPNTLLSSVYREKLFSSHPSVGELAPTLLHVFVSIEMTGQSVAFEQKFQYRRPMYVVLEYLWNFEVHQRKMKELAIDAEKNIESPRPPIFLHFINLLINDAIFLLDEALSYMSKLRELQQARSEQQQPGQPQLSAEQQQQQEANFQHTGLLAKFHNVMSNETIRTLARLTAEIQSIFCHPSIVERMTAMLNYFLLNLVGPQKKNFKVRDLREYEFKPPELVRDICRIYDHLGREGGGGGERFCAAVSRDGRSYTPHLFPLALAVLNKIGQVQLAERLDAVAQRVHKLALKQAQDEELLSEAPEEFFDPIMNTLMHDPVKLPSSGVTVDRATIARHLLSDQTDPFNRSPLTMDMVVPDDQLREKMESWCRERRASSSSSSSS